MKKRVLSWGTLMCDIIAAGLEKVAEPGVIEYLTQGIELRLGGHPVDVIIDLAQIGVDPNQIAFVSTIGTDLFGDLLLQQIGRYGFESFVERVDGGTGKTMILSVRGQDRLCHLDVGACMNMSIRHLEDAIEQTRPEFFTFRPGYTNLDAEMAPMLEKLRDGVLRDTFVLLDICSPYNKPWAYYLPLFSYVDAVHGNSKEIIRASGEETIEKAAARILSLGADAVLLTKEQEGAEILTDRYRVSQPAFKIRPVEPSGCGDAFCAGVVYSLMHTEKRVSTMDEDGLAGLLMWGQALGASAATEVGCVAGVTQANVRQLLEGQEDRVLRETTAETLWRSRHQREPGGRAQAPSKVRTSSVDAQYLKAASGGYAD